MITTLDRLNTVAAMADAIDRSALASFDRGEERRPTPLDWAILLAVAPAAAEQLARRVYLMSLNH